MRNTRAVVAAAVAAFLAGGKVAANDQPSGATTVSEECFGVRGTSTCKGFLNSCVGLNACKPSTKVDRKPGEWDQVAGTECPPAAVPESRGASTATRKASAKKVEETNSGTKK